MSIPPLVCSTPPPPEQCEDDKDHEDFDITYNLSQEEEEDDSAEYNYGNYSSYNVYQNTSQNAVKEKWNAEISHISDNIGETNIKSKEILNDVNVITNNELGKQGIPKYEESVVEDLNLIVDKDIVHSNNSVSKEFKTESEVEFECLDKPARIHEDGANISIEDKNTDITVINKLSIPDENESLDDKHEEVKTNIVETTTDDISEIKHVNSSEIDIPDTTNIEPEQSITDQIVSIITENPKLVDQTDAVKTEDESSPDNGLDDFGDFEDFQFTSTSESCKVLSVNNENPWESDCVEGSDFGDFTANFDVKEPEPVESITEPASSEEKEIKTTISQEDDEDDFGDFDDFRSSDNKETLADVNKVASTPDVNLWSLSSPDNDLQILDSIDTVLASIFPEQIPEPENEFVGRLESFLRETWGHMVDIEVRQPYMVNWNNSLGQKTLLKALCIDSRNILFGPKWNMPKYAVNLTAAPLQPQKQFVPLSTAEPGEKVPSKDTGAWVDPFTPDGQESCNTENKSLPTEPAIRPTDLDVFESDTSTKLSKIYSSTINVQPLRHINLPDTHIFTPTDSETPRSKTIHYDSGPSGLLPQTVHESNPRQSDNLPPQVNETDDKEYWDFQDFKGATISSPTSITQTTETEVSSAESVTSQAGVTYQTQILQPIKIDPIMPTLNWPDPGEVKETFDDFSEFISSTAWSEKEYQSAPVADTKSDNQNHKSSKAEVVATDVDDEFETFQSAPPASTSAIDFNINTLFVPQFSSPQNLTMKTFENCDIPIKAEIKNSKISNSVNLGNHSVVTNNVSQLQELTFPTQPTSGISNISSDILQPINASSSSSRNQHRSGQILQPLSLESYSQINWPNPGIDLQDLSRFNPINSLNSLKSDSSTGGNSKNSSPAHSSANVAPQASDDDIWGDFVSSAPKPQHPTPKKTTFADDDEWTDFVSSPSMKPQNGLNTISFNVHTNLSMQKSSTQNNVGSRTNQISLDIPKLNYITPKSSSRGYSEKHFQNL